jgi:cytochrome c biogenesis protein CcmG, thiol:disulfide interchange protein DsbE
VAHPFRSRPARLALILVPAVLFVGVLAVGLRHSDEGAAPGDRAPEFAAAALDGSRDVSLNDLLGRPILLNFWASWCGPCVDEAPMLRRAHERFGDQVEFVGIDVRDSRSDALEFVARHRLDYLHLRDEDLTIYDRYGLTGQPESFLIGADGNIVEHVAGPFLTDDDLFALLDRVATAGD